MLLAQFVDSLIMFTAGLVGCWYGYGPIPAGPKQADWAAWHARWGNLMRIGGPLLIAVALLQILTRAIGW
jgi:hypothetical protein